MTLLLESPQLANRWCREQRENDKKIGYVPTMGALHDGHLSLIGYSVAENDLTCASIFVNPLQFNNPDDLKNYPRTMETDLQKLEQAQCSMVYTGTLEHFFPDEDVMSDCAHVNSSPAMQGLEATHRPGHLEGVSAIVEKLFDTVGECRAYFGQKDFQQTLIVREIARHHQGIDIVVCPTVRERSGLAMSSRNQRLSSEGRTLAASLYQALSEAESAWTRGERDPKRLEQLMSAVLDRPGIKLEYAAIRDPERWTTTTPATLHDSAQALVAAEIEGIRLIDNIPLSTMQSEPPLLK